MRTRRGFEERGRSWVVPRKRARTMTLRAERVLLGLGRSITAKRQTRRRVRSFVVRTATVRFPTLAFAWTFPTQRFARDPRGKARAPETTRRLALPRLG